MNTTTLHIPVNKSVKERAESVVKAQGYSSLQEILRVFLFSLAKEQIKPGFIHTDMQVALTPAQEKYLQSREKQTKKAIKAGKAYSARTVSEMISILKRNPKKNE